MNNSQHIIAKAVFDISFSTENEAFTQQTVLSTFVSDELMAEVDDVFNDFSDSHSVLKISHLEVDLGVVPYQNYQAEITIRLRKQLSARLRELQAITKTRGDGEDVLSMDREFSELETLHYFMRYGYFPWYSPVHSVDVMQRRFMQVVESQREDLIGLLASMISVDNALENLAEVLPLEGLIMIARQLLHREFDTVLKIFMQLLDYQISQGCFKRVSRQNREACLRDLWSGMIAVLLYDNGSRRNTATVISAFLMRCVGENRSEFEKIRIELLQSGVNDVSKMARLLGSPTSDRNELNQNRVIYISNLICVLDCRDAVKLRQLWLSLLSDDPERVSEILRHIAFYTSCRNQVIEQFNETMLYEWFVITNAHQVEYILFCQLCFVSVASHQGHNEKQAYSYFWDYALRYCACCEPTRFDRSQFFYNLFHKEDLFDQNKSKFFLFQFFNENNRFVQYQNDLKVVLNRLQHEAERPVSESSAENENFDAITLSEYMASGNTTDLKKISAQWSFILETHAVLLLHLVRVYGCKTEIRETFIRTLSSYQLRDLVGLLVPVSKEFVHDIITLFSSASSSDSFSEVNRPSASCNEHSLWGFTLDFILVECGSRFNKKEYCSSLLRETAAHNNGSYRDLLVIIQSWFLTLAERHGVTQELLSIINELVEEFPQVSPCKPTITSVSEASVLRQLDAVDVALINNMFIENAQSLFRDFASDYVAHTNKNEAELKKLFALLCKKHSLAVSPYVISLINAMASCLGKEKREKIQFEALMFSCRYLSSDVYITPEAFIRLLANHLIVWSGSDVVPFYARVILQLNQASADQRVAQEVIKNLSTLVLPQLNKMPSPPPRLTEPSLFDGTTVYIKNAGQVLLTPYFPVLFERLGLIEHGQFIDEEARARAVHALQYLVDGTGELPEYMMVLNKLICGVESGRLVAKGVLISDVEKKLIDGLLAAAIENWQGLGNTSIDGLRESFLKREGKLQFKDNQWYLVVESRSYDMLLDRLPWSYSTIKHAWMPHVIHVEWR
ncbi:hypothetical protein MNBD_GAMMA16-1530 [hydrothermal vent metagenome]|uniref:Uncharacterized protein n=1 Tax=hydrothermal vent metagenome TaxID=652676 RepID=A0A3B0ZFW9_9ZZZZ